MIFQKFSWWKRLAAVTTQILFAWPILFYMKIMDFYMSIEWCSIFETSYIIIVMIFDNSFFSERNLENFLKWLNQEIP